MKTIAYVTSLLAITATAAFADNGSQTLSPRAQSQIIKVVPVEKMAKVEKGDSCCRATTTALSPRAASQRVRIVSTGDDSDFAHSSSTLSPRAQSQLDESSKRFEIAPVK